jgi:hypothetical protein
VSQFQRIWGVTVPKNMGCHSSKEYGVSQFQRICCKEDFESGIVIKKML